MASICAVDRGFDLGLELTDVDVLLADFGRFGFLGGSRHRLPHDGEVLGQVA